MHCFQYKKNQLYCENVRIQKIADECGTPLYIYSYHTLIDHFNKIKNAFKKIKPIICFAAKANDNLAVLKSLIDQGAGCDIVSEGELRKAMKVNADPAKIVFASVGKTDQEIELALRTDILFFNVESLPELEQINRIAKSMKKRARAALRINPDVDAATHQRITTGTLKNKFGIDFSTARDILRQRDCFSFVQINGLHIHIGSQITTLDPYIFSIKKVLKFLEELRSENIDIEYFDLGGGFAINYKDSDAKTADEIAEAIVPLLQETGLKIILEPGRFIAGNAGVFVTKVLYLKDNGFKKFLIVDGGMNDLIRPTLYDAYHEIVPVQRTTAESVKVDVVGPICESGDYFAKDRILQGMKKNEFMAIMSAGAYGYVMSSNYNVRGRPAEVMVKGNKFEVIKERETFKDLIRGERVPSFLS